MRRWILMLLLAAGACQAGNQTLTIGYQKGGGLLALLKVQRTW